jgi:7-carboxy-7-deazaguanine synthase
MKMPVLEIFGPTIQGEGAVIGKKTVFIRTAGCDYKCSWCDSAFTWDGTGKADIQMMTCAEIIKELETIDFKNFKHVTISGGNPALIEQIGELIDALKKRNVKVCLETQGSIWQEWMLQVDDLTISPKPPSS